MSGHSHWAKIKRAKGAVDAKRGKLWSKLSREIIVAAKSGGGDPTMNLKLRYAIDKAREVSMPGVNIERAIKRGTGETGGQIFEEINYEGYGPGGVALLVEILTDNRNRTAGELRKTFEKGGGKMASAGAVAYLFERKGVFAVSASATDEDTLMDFALDAGAEDIKHVGDTFEVTCDPTAFVQVKAALEAQELTPLSAGIHQIAKVPVDADTETGLKILRLMDALDDHDDVQNVYANLNVTDEMLAASE
jgi:YebC/PmpR family DNA-binding regulatory protein